MLRAVQCSSENALLFAWNINLLHYVYVKRNLNNCRINELFVRILKKKKKDRGRRLRCEKCGYKILLVVFVSRYIMQIEKFKLTSGSHRLVVIHIFNIRKKCNNVGKTESRKIRERRDDRRIAKIFFLSFFFSGIFERSRLFH